jgi:hypothetical protein
MGFQIHKSFFGRRIFEVDRRTLALACLFSIVSLAQMANGQRAGLDTPSRFMERIDAEEGERRINDFRRQRLRGDYCFEFELEHKPRRSRTARYAGIMWGSWNEKGPITRIRVESDPESRDSGSEFVELIVQNGPHPEAWIRREQGEAFQPIRGAALFEPIIPGVLYTPFDLQMPFIYWDDYVYEGPTRVGVSRVAHQFLMFPPETFSGDQRKVKGVRLGLDSDYNALLRIEMLNTDDVITSRFTVEGFRKVDEQYIVKRITLTDYPSKDRTTFDVEEASVGLSLHDDMFDPDQMYPAQALRSERASEL